MIEKLIEDHHDECLRILNENGIEEKDLRKVIISNMSFISVFIRLYVI